MSKMQDSRKLTDDNKKRKRKPHVVAICSSNERKQATFSIHSKIHIEIWNIIFHLPWFLYLNGLRIMYTLHIYSQICPLPLCIFKERMCCSLHIPSGYFCSKTYMYQIYLLRTTGNKEWWTSSCVFYCCVSRTQSDMLGIEKTKSDHTY